jgi:hypothetical protein
MSEYSPEEWEKLWQESNGHICGLISGESAPEPRSRRAVLVGALLTAISPLIAQTGRIRIVIVDPNKAVIPGAEVALLGKDDKPVRTQRSDGTGVSRWSELPMGDVKFRVTSYGFNAKPIVVTIKNADELSVEVTLEPGGTQGGVIRAEIPPV